MTLKTVQLINIIERFKIELNCILLGQMNLKLLKIFVY